MKLNKIQTAVIALIIANIIWGVTPPIFKWALEDITPFTLAFLRFFLAAIIFLPFIHGQSLKIAKKDWGKVFLLTFVGIFIHISFFFLGLELTSSINAPIIGSAAPIFLIIAGIVFLREHPGKKKIIGGLIGLFGVLIIVLLPVLGQEFDGALLGNLFLIVSTVGAVFHSVILKELSKDYNPIPLIFWSFAGAAFMFFPMFVNDAVSNQALSSIGLQGLIGVLFGGIFASAIAYSLFYWAMKYMLASEVGLFTYIDPVAALLIAVPLLGEIPTPTYFLGAILVFAGIYVAEGRLHWHPLHLLKSK